MARIPIPVEETPAYDFYREWCTYSASADVVPDPWVFWREIFVGHLNYKMSKGSFEYHLIRLQMGKHPLVWRDDVTKAWRLRDIDVSEK